MSKTIGINSKEVLILDDEPEYLQWVQDFFESKNLQVEFVRNLEDALKRLEEKEYRLILADMNVPGAEAFPPDTLKKYPLASKYPGLLLTIRARTKGYGAHSVIAYTVHDDEALDKELQKTHSRYVLKARPQVFKSVIEKSLLPSPK